MLGHEQKKSITITISTRAYQTLKAHGSELGYQPTPYATMLFEAAFAARCAQLRNETTGDSDLDEMVRLVLKMAGRANTAAIAKYLGIPEPVVVRIIDGWRQVGREMKTASSPRKAAPVTDPADQVQGPAIASSHKRILTWISRQNGTEMKPLSYSEIQDSCVVAAPTVAAATTRLKELGFLEVEKIGLRNHYRVTEAGRRILDGTE